MLRHTNTYWGKIIANIVTPLALIIALIGLFFPPLSANNDLQQRLSHNPWQDEWLWLDANEQHFGLWQWHRTGNPKGLLIVFHGQGQHADWPDQVRNMRLEIPRSGWATLSVQVPEDMEQPAFNQLVNQALQLGSERNILNSALLAIGSHSNQLLDFGVKQAPRLDNFGLYFISLYWQPLAGYDAPDLISQLQYPMLDLWHGHGQEQQVQAVQRRAAATRRQNQRFQQIENAQPPARTQVYADRDTRRVWGWLQTNAQGAEARRAN